MGDGMYCDYELGFLQDILKKSHIRMTLLSAQDRMDTILHSTTIAKLLPSAGASVGQLLGHIEAHTKYFVTDELMLRYILVQLPASSTQDLLFIGPYLPAPLSTEAMLEIGESLGLSPNAQKYLENYFDALPIVSENDRLHAVVDTFCERIWKPHAFAIAKLERSHLPVTAPVGASAHGTDFDELLADMEKMETRYGFENELIQAVVLGQQHKISMLASGFDDRMFERRLADPLRNAKNYCIIMNTLLRKAAEQGGVHPLYIDRTSSQLATKIELTTEVKTIPALMEEMFSAYCQLVRKHATKGYSTVVKKAILLIDADISAELSLATIAQKLEVSAGYLSTIFRKETGSTLSAHIRTRRISHAAHLLRTTGLQIQTIAMHCGILDVQYFSKLFKRQLGKTPNEYRRAARR